MLKIDYYENESKKLAGSNYCCASINTDDYRGYTMLEQIEPRCETYEEAKKELLEYVTKLRDELSAFIERETSMTEVINLPYEFNLRARNDPCNKTWHAIRTDGGYNVEYGIFHITSMYFTNEEISRKIADGDFIVID